VGRLLITFLLCWRGVLRRPLLYLSDFFRQRREEYYSRLQAIRDRGDWEGWMRFFLEGVKSVALEATDTARRIQALRDQHRGQIVEAIGGTATGLILLDHLFQKPFITVNQVSEVIRRTYPVANLVASFEKLGLLRKTARRRRNRVYAYQPYLDLLEGRG